MTRLLPGGATLVMAALFFLGCQHPQTNGHGAVPALAPGTNRISADQDVSLIASSGLPLRGTELDVGYRTFVTGTEGYATALHFPLPPRARASAIQHAALKIHYRGAWGTHDPRAVHVHRISEPWTEATVRFDVARTRSFASARVGGADAKWITFDVTAAVRDWARDLGQNFGLLLTSPPSGHMDTSERFDSTRGADHAFDPVLEITYGEPEGKQQGGK